MSAWRRLIVCGLAVGLAVLGAAGCRREKPKTMYEAQEDARRHMDQEQQRRHQEARRLSEADLHLLQDPDDRAKETKRRAFDKAQEEANKQDVQEKWLREEYKDEVDPGDDYEYDAEDTDSDEFKTDAAGGD